VQSYSARNRSRGAGTKFVRCNPYVKRLRLLLAKKGGRRDPATWVMSELRQYVRSTTTVGISS